MLIIQIMVVCLPHQNHDLGQVLVISATTPAAYWSGVMVSASDMVSLVFSPLGVCQLSDLPGVRRTWASNASDMGE